MASQNVYVQSIKPESLKALRDVKHFAEFMGFFENDCKVFINTCLQIKELENRLTEIFANLQSKNLERNFIDRTATHSILTSIKLTPLDKHLKLLWDEYNANEESIREDFKNRVGKGLTLPLPDGILDGLTTQEKAIVQQCMNDSFANYVNFIVGIGGLINSLFFGFESQCKVLCAFACYSFSISYSRDYIIQHREILATLRKLGNSAERAGECEICVMQSNCTFALSFDALANIYCYAIKVRMLADYGTLFYTNKLWENLKIYFDNMRKIVTNQVSITEKCLEGIS